MIQMVKLFFVGLTVISASVQASAQATGLKCSMEYSTSGPLESYSISDSSWLSPGDSMKGIARSSDGDGIAGTSPANYLEVAQQTVHGELFWQLTVLNAEKSVIGMFGFPEKEGMKTTFKVNALDNDSEDPATFDTLQVTCHFTYFAG